MSTWSQYWTRLRKNPAPRQVTWLCGNEPILIDEVVNHILSVLGPDETGRVSLSAGLIPEKDVWAALDQQPLGPGVRVVIVRHADQLQDWDRFIDWITNRTRNPRTYLVFISDEERVPRVELTPEQKRAHEKPGPAPHIAAIGAKGHVVECRPFTSATAKVSLEWVKSKVPMRDTVAKHLLERANWDLRLVRDTLLKLSVFPGEVTVQVINALMSQRPRDTFTDALLALDKKTALLALEDVRPDDVGRLIGLLDHNLDLAGTIYDMRAEHKSSSDMAKALGPQAFLIKDLMKVSRHYDIRRRAMIRQSLAMADVAYRNGHTTGVLEAVVTQW